MSAKVTIAKGRTSLRSYLPLICDGLVMFQGGKYHSTTVEAAGKRSVPVGANITRF